MNRNHLDRRDFGIAAGSSLLVAAVPSLVLADNDDRHADHVGPHGRRHRHTGGAKHHGRPPTESFIQQTWRYDFPKGVANFFDPTGFDFPRHGRANLLIDYKGN